MNELGKFFLSEFIGSFVLILFGNGVVACAELTSSKGSIRTGIKNWLSIGGGLNWLGISIGWGLAIFLGVIFSEKSGHQINPAATLFDVFRGLMGGESYYNQANHHYWWALIAFIAQFSGMFISQLVLDAIFWLQLRDTEAFESVSMHCTSPAALANKEKVHNKKAVYLTSFLGEFIGTTVLLCAITVPNIVAKSNNGSILFDGNGVLFATVAGLTVMGLALTTGGLTGPALNPFRDLAPRVVFSVLKIPNKQKGDAQWDYAWVPVFAPLSAAIFSSAIVIGLTHAFA